MTKNSNKKFLPDKDAAPPALAVGVISMICGLVAFGIVFWGISVANRLVIVSGAFVFIACLIVCTISFVFHAGWLIKRIWKKPKD